jgi:uncharacterized damage-inducible protein DinB
MITPAYATTMSAYNAELNRRVHAAASRLSDAERRADGGVFWRSLHATLSHLLWADHMWMSRLAGWQAPGVRLADSGGYIADWDVLAGERVATDQRLIAWAGGLDQAWIDGTLTWFSGATQRQQTRPRALVVAHLFNHQTHHRGQAHALLTRHGQDTGATDLPFVLP